MRGTLVAIGGNEDKETDPKVLRQVLRLAGESPRVEVIPTASSIPEEVARDYDEAFRRLGAVQVGTLDIRKREDADDPEAAKRIARTDVIFLTGGDQLRLTTLLAGTRVGRAMRKHHRDGKLIAGTSAGAAAMSGTMIFEGDPASSMRKGNVQMTPGLGLADRCVIDTHFLDRGRLGRLLEVVVSNPDFVGIGLSEDTAAILRPQGHVDVVGRGVVVVVEGHLLGYSNISEVQLGAPIAAEGLLVHTLVDGCRFDMEERRYFSKEAMQAGNGDARSSPERPARSKKAAAEEPQREEAR